MHVSRIYSPRVLEEPPGSKSAAIPGIRAKKSANARLNSCTIKDGWLSKHAAEKFNNKRNELGDNGEVYWCKHCSRRRRRGVWHIGHLHTVRRRGRR